MSVNIFTTMNFDPLQIKVRDQLCAIATRLHEKDTTRKEEHSYVGKPSLSNSYKCESIDGNRHFLIFSSNNLFNRLIMEEELSRKVIKDFPEQFGTNNAMDVLQALWIQDPLFPEIEFDCFCEILRHEQFAWVVEYNNDGIVGDKILRLDLYRKMDERKDGCYDFTGGLMHVFKHFNCYGHPISSQKSNNTVPNLRYILNMIIEAFFMSELVPDKKDGKQKYIGCIDYKGKAMKAIFFNNEDAGVWFIDSFYEK